MAKQVPTNSRTLVRARELGWTIAKTEQWIKHPGMAHGKRKDLWGFGDALAFKGHEITLFQSCARSGVSDHWAKLVDECTAEAHGWLFAGGVIEIWGWFKRKIPGERRLWHVDRWRVGYVAPRDNLVADPRVWRTSPDGTRFFRYKMST